MIEEKIKKIIVKKEEGASNVIDACVEYYVNKKLFINNTQIKNGLQLVDLLKYIESGFDYEIINGTNELTIRIY